MQVWRSSNFQQRKLVLRVMLKYIVEHQDSISRVSARDSGKPMVDAAFGEVMVTCEKICWLLKEGRRHLMPEKRSAGYMVTPRPSALHPTRFARHKVLP